MTGWNKPASLAVHYIAGSCQELTVLFTVI